MPTSGLSLVGFMDPSTAIHHLRNACIPVQADDAALLAEHDLARQKLGAPVANAGNPEIIEISAVDKVYIDTLVQQPWISKALTQFSGATFKLVEIEPLLAYQFSIDESRSQHHCGKLNTPPNLDELLKVCLPIALPNEQITVSQNLNSVVLKSKSLNFRMMAAGIFEPSFIGIEFGVSLSLSHVVRMNGRCYLHNGFHRALGARNSGATHIPCLFRDVNTPSEAGIIGGGATFPIELLESANPPTLAHFTQGRAHHVSLRATSRILQVTWTDHVVPEE
jgi:hypothetical protein